MKKVTAASGDYFVYFHTFTIVSYVFMIGLGWFYGTSTITGH